jgi:hypothetical protein
VVLTGIVGFSMFRPTISHTVDIADMEEEAVCFLKFILRGLKETNRLPKSTVELGRSSALEKDIKAIK